MRGSQMSAIFRRVNCGARAGQQSYPYMLSTDIIWISNSGVVTFVNDLGESVTFGEVDLQPEQVPEPPRVDLNVQVPEPPRAAEFLVGLFAKKRYRNGLLQNLEEDFNNDIVSGMSIWRARWRYRSAALNSIGPQFWMFVKRIGLVTAAFAEFARRLLH